MLSEKDNVVRAERGEPVKKLVVVRSVGIILACHSSQVELACTFKVLKKVSNSFTLILEDELLIRLRVGGFDWAIIISSIFSVFMTDSGHIRLGERSPMVCGGVQSVCWNLTLPFFLDHLLRSEI
jgi:hypothetical protein